MFEYLPLGCSNFIIFTRFAMIKGGSKPHYSAWTYGDMKLAIEVTTSWMLAVSDLPRMFKIAKNILKGRKKTSKDIKTKAKVGYANVTESVVLI